MNLKQKLSKKLKKTGGFTLIEMLIVVAIIAILVAVSIPMVNANLEKARTATDDANERAAKAAALATFMLAETPPTLDSGNTTATYYYDAEDGTVQQTNTTGIVGYNQVTHGDQDKGEGCVQVIITIATGVAETSWTAAGSVAGG